jgi:hypothetical protein
MNPLVKRILSSYNSTLGYHYLAVTKIVVINCHTFQLKKIFLTKLKTKAYAQGAARPITCRTEMKIINRMTCLWCPTVFYKPIIKQEQEEYVYERRGTYDE